MSLSKASIKTNTSHHRPVELEDLCTIEEVLAGEMLPNGNLPYGYLLRPKPLSLRQLPPHAFFAALPESLRPNGQDELDQTVMVSNQDGARDLVADDAQKGAQAGAADGVPEGESARDLQIEAITAVSLSIATSSLFSIGSDGVL